MQTATGTAAANLIIETFGDLENPGEVHLEGYPTYAVERSLEWARNLHND